MLLYNGIVNLSLLWDFDLSLLLFFCRNRNFFFNWLCLSRGHFWYAILFGRNFVEVEVHVTNGLVLIDLSLDIWFAFQVLKLFISQIFKIFLHLFEFCQSFPLVLKQVIELSEESVTQQPIFQAFIYLDLTARGLRILNKFLFLLLFNRRFLFG